MSLSAITGREASIFACLTDTVVAPEPVLPPVRETDAALFFDRWMGRMPRLNRVALRALLHALELAPRFGGGRRLRRLERGERAELLAGLERHSSPHVRNLTKLVVGLCQLAYYGDDEVMRQVGYDPDANVRRGRELRATEGRP